VKAPNEKRGGEFYPGVLSGSDTISLGLLKNIEAIAAHGGAL